MKKVSLAVLISLSALTGAAYAQSDNGITESTDPQQAAQIEQHAQELQSHQQSDQSMSNMQMNHNQHHRWAHKHHPMHGHSTHKGQNPEQDDSQ